MYGTGKSVRQQPGGHNCRQDNKNVKQFFGGQLDGQYVSENKMYVYLIQCLKFYLKGILHHNFNI